MCWDIGSFDWTQWILASQRNNSSSSARRPRFWRREAPFFSFFAHNKDKQEQSNEKINEARKQQENFSLSFSSTSNSINFLVRVPVKAFELEKSHARAQVYLILINVAI